MSVSFGSTTDKEKETFRGKKYDRHVLDGPNFSNDNAVAVLRCLDIYDEDLAGIMTVNDIQCALAIARAVWQDEAVKYTREDEHNENFHSYGLDEEGLQRRINNLAEFVESAKRLGASHITWG